MPAGSRLVWINGPFGGGKSSVARALVERWDGAVLFDPEHLGFVLRGMLPVPTGDFQDLREWRELVIATASILTRAEPRLVVMPMTVLRAAYCDELGVGLAATDAVVEQVLLEVPRAQLERQILGATDEPASTVAWRLQKLDEYLSARASMAARSSFVINTNRLGVDAVAAALMSHLGPSVPAGP